MSTAGILTPTQVPPPPRSVALAAMLAVTPPLLSPTARDILRDLLICRQSPTWSHPRRDWNLSHLISQFGTLLTYVHLRRMPDAASTAMRCLILLRMIHAPKDEAEQDAAWLRAREELSCHFNPGWPQSVEMLTTALGAALEEPLLRRVCAVDHLAELLLTTAKAWPVVPPPPVTDGPLRPGPATATAVPDNAAA